RHPGADGGRDRAGASAGRIERLHHQPAGEGRAADRNLQGRHSVPRLGCGAHDAARILSRDLALSRPRIQAVALTARREGAAQEERRLTGWARVARLRNPASTPHRGLTRVSLPLNPGYVRTAADEMP